MGGELIVESEIGKGSAFKVSIPDIASLEKTSGTVAKPKPVVLQKKLPKNMLIVDDSKVNRAVLTALLKKLGISSVEQACDGADALKKLDSAAKEDRLYDFILTDLWMPNMNGMEFIERMRADSRVAHIPVFALTADTEFHRDDRTKLFTGILLKPLTYGKLQKVFSISGSTVHSKNV